MRVVASPDALDAAIWKQAALVLRFAPDDAFAIGAAGVDISDEDAIVADESGFLGAWMTTEELAEHVLSHIEWPLPEARPGLGQGLIAGVPSKLWLTADRALLVCPAAYAHELAERLA